MELVKKPVVYGSKEDGGKSKESYPAEKGVKGSEEFAAERFHMVHRAHSCQDHGGVQEGIDQAQTAEEVISGGADSN